MSLFIIELDRTSHANRHFSVSPTPFWEFFDIEVGTGIETINTYTTGVETFCGSSSAGDDLDASFIYFPTSAAFYTRVERVTVGQDFVGTLVDELAESGTTIPGLEDCTIRNGDGEPRVHVAVTALTDHSSTTLRRDGNFPTSAAPVTTRPAEVTPAPQPPPPAPETTQQPAPVDPPLPTPALPANPNPAPPNSEVGPGPSNGNPGPSNGNPGPSNGNPGPSNGNPGPSNGGPAPVRPTNQPAPVVAPSLTIGTTVVPVTAIGTNNGGVVIGGSTLLPSSVVTFQDNTISLGPSGTNLVIVGPAGPSTVPLFVPAPGAAPAVTGNPQPADSIVIGTQTIPLSLPSNTGQGVILPGGTTLAPGSVVTFQGQTLSLAPGGSSIVVAASGSQSTIALYTPAATNAAQETVLSVGSSPYTIAYVTASEGGVVLPGGQTLLPGSTTVVDGTTLSLGPQGTELVVGTSTVPLQPAQTTDADTSTTSSGTGGNGPSPTSTPEEFTAGAGRNVDGWRSGAGFAAAVVAILQVVL